MEVVIAVTIFSIVTLSVYKAYTTIMEVSRASRLKVLATALSSEQFEIVRNLAYVDVGVVGGDPSGRIPATQSLVRGGVEFVVDTAVQNVDDPFDGVSPVDTEPADYKLVQVSLSCPMCKNFLPTNFVTYIAPRSLEND